MSSIAGSVWVDERSKGLWSLPDRCWIHESLTMRLEITQRADLAVRALVLLQRSPLRLKSVDLAAALGTTAGFVPQVMGPLVRAGWVRSVPGRRGLRARCRPRWVERVGCCRTSRWADRDRTMCGGRSTVRCGEPVRDACRMGSRAPGTGRLPVRVVVVGCRAGDGMTAAATDQEAGERRGIDVIVTHYRFKETNS